MVTTRACAVVLGSLIVALVCGCGAGAAQEPAPSYDPVFDELVQTAIVEAQAGEASEDQLAILQAALEGGEVTLEQARQAARDTVDCFVAAGLQGSFVERTDATGLVVPGYTVGSTSDDMTPIDRCDRENGFWVSKVYQLQPASERMRTEFFDLHAEAMRECLEGAGYETDPDATGADLARQAATVSAETQGEVDCIATVSG